MPDKDVVREPARGKAVWMIGGLYEVKLSGSETAGALTIMEMTMPTGWGPPPHTHNGDETLYVLDGKLTYHLGDKTIDAGPGYLIHVTAGTWEWFEPRETCRVLVHYMPGGIDEFFLEAGEPAARYELPPMPKSPPDYQRLAAIGSRYGLQLRPPPGM
jgi:quercetin dioxygenase-like cupin family protein